MSNPPSAHHHHIIVTCAADSGAALHPPHHATTISPSGRHFRCAVGRGGIGLKRREGDGVTPVGCWPIRTVLFRPDKIATPLTALPTTPIATDDGWVDAPADPAYNSQVKLPYPASHELLWRPNDNLYDLVLVLGFNDAPVVPGAGSAIFMHVATPEYSPTAGCIGLALDDLTALLADCLADTHVVIQAPGGSYNNRSE